MVGWRARRRWAGLGVAGALLVGLAAAPMAVADDSPAAEVVTLPAPVVAPSTDAVPTGVVTLGDSFSSGLGAGGYVNGCDNTPNAWGNLIFGSAVTDRTMLACSGATIPTVRAQVDELAANPGSGRLVTVTVGGNDAGFAAELQRCFVSNCTGRETQIRSKIDGLVGPLTQIYREIKVAAPNDTVIVGGYPLLVPDPRSRSWCTALTFLLTNAERDMIRRLGVRLNDVIDTAAAQAGVAAVTSDLEHRFTGHEACRNSSTDWIYGLKISLWSQDLDTAVEAMQVDAQVEEYYVDPQAEIVAGWIRDSFHPTRSGQVAYADAFEASYRG